MEFSGKIHKQKVMLKALLLLACALPLCAGNGCSSFTDFFSEKDLTKIPLDQVLNNGKPTLADFGWRDCEPCKKMKIVLGSLESKYRGRLNVVIVEAYNHRDLMDRYNINAISTDVLIAAGEIAGVGSGLKDITAELIKRNKMRIQVLASYLLYSLSGYSTIASSCEL
jgi:thiol-disulfide isomerase/thioredoxin